MNFIFWSIIIGVASFTESTIIFLPLTIATLTLLAIYQERGDVFTLAMLGGIFLDLLQVRTLGTTSLLFLLILILLVLYKRKVIGKNPIFVGTAIFFSTFFYSYLVFPQLETNLSQAVVLTFLTLVFAIFLRPKDEMDRIQF